ncbi:MAG TPA: hypothetical protein DIU15_06870 [Deltaproteobacteria bacterium]|nr:hypothetical protein [Deltaproteobacteria bacterium]HCP45745.1 hypothetical protein [Deltaproteobacteria bacterium]
MASSPSNDTGSRWLEVSVRVPDHLSAALSDLLLELGAVGLAEDHPGLHLEDDPNAPIISGDPHWAPPPPINPSPELIIRSWFPEPSPGQLDGDLPGAIRAWLTEHQLSGDQLTLAPLQEQDWNASWREGFRDFRLSPRLHVVPSWLTPPPLPAEVRVLRLEPDMAFGTGTHFTTSACASLVDGWLAARGAKATTVLDVGTGTGVLALGALLLGATHAVGLDTDPAAVTSAMANARANHLDAQLEVRLGGPDSGPTGTYDLVTANLLAPVLIELAPLLSARVASGGALVISGMLRHQASEVLEELQPLGLRQRERLDDDEWVAVLLDRPGNSQV